MMKTPKFHFERLRTCYLKQNQYDKVEKLFCEGKMTRDDFFAFVDYYQKPQIRKLYTMNLN